jgi:hypothetical protein
MDANVIAKRIFFIFGLLLTGAILLYGFAGKFLAPLAVTLLPTQTAQAHYARSAGYYLSENDSQSRKLRIPVDFDGQTQTLTFVTSMSVRTPVALVDPENMPKLPTPDPLRFLKPYSRPNTDPDRVFPVRYVPQFPPTVMLDRPNATLWTYYADLWMIGDFVSFLMAAGAFSAFAYFFRRHLRGGAGSFR